MSGRRLAAGEEALRRAWERGRLAFRRKAWVLVLMPAGEYLVARVLRSGSHPNWVEMGCGCPLPCVLLLDQGSLRVYQAIGMAAVVHQQHRAAN